MAKQLISGFSILKNPCRIRSCIFQATTLLQSHQYSEADRSWEGEGLSWGQSGSVSHTAQQIQRPEVLECEALRDSPLAGETGLCVSLHGC